MKIGLTGTISCGKTTLVNELAKLEQFKEYKTATERSKYLRDQGIALNTDSTLKGQLVFAAERSLELMNENIITDRTCFDVCAFTLSSQTISQRQKELYTNLVMELRNDYDLIIYVSPKGVEIENNGVRETNSDYRDKIDNVINLILDEYPPKQLLRIEGTIEQRISQIEQYLLAHFKN
jgi:nicotinamide riboside kinase